ncbi:MAG: indolepyruvate oxidoreductase subunit beta [Thermoprotei archaeon]|nr:MAG: indolepyruvate oxidoreductase subunit beta [Thermoprotei archaeon]
MTNLLIASVGGQGGLTLSRVIASAALKEGKRVIVGETLGMSQRGGSVHVYIRLGERAYSPLFSPGEADIVLGLEPVETLRALKYIGKHTLVVLNTRPIHTITTLLGLEAYSSIEEVIGRIKNRSKKVLAVNSYEECVKLNFPKGVNMHVLGVAVGITGVLRPETIKAAIRELLKYPQKNLEIFERGLALGKEISRSIMG